MPIKWTPERINTLRRILARSWQWGETFKPDDTVRFETELMKSMYPTLGKRVISPKIYDRSSPVTGEFLALRKGIPSRGRKQVMQEYDFGVKPQWSPESEAKTIAHEIGHGIDFERRPSKYDDYPNDVISKEGHKRTPEEWRQYLQHPTEVSAEKIAALHKANRQNLLQTVQREEIWKEPRVVPPEYDYVHKRLLDRLRGEPKFADKVVKVNELRPPTDAEHRKKWGRGDGKDPVRNVIGLIAAVRDAFGTRPTGRALRALGWNLEELVNPPRNIYKRSTPMWNNWPSVQPGQNTFPVQDYRDVLLGLPADYQRRVVQESPHRFTNEPYKEFLKALSGSKPK
jgi:hypothetical protein